jgi:hypothetical protein
MRKIRYFITEKYFLEEDLESITGELEVPEEATIGEINKMLLGEVAITVKSNQWTVEWNYI